MLYIWKIPRFFAIRKCFFKLFWKWKEFRTLYSINQVNLRSFKGFPESFLEIFGGRQGEVFYTLQISRKF